MPKSDLTFGTFSTSTSGGKYYKTQPINFPTPEKDVEVYEVPGRSGDLIVDYGSYKNVEITAEIAIQATAPDTFLTLYDALRVSIMVQSGYQRLEDSLYPNEYRVARCTGVEMQQADSMRGTATITFDAKPQRYLTSGEAVALSIIGTGQGLQTFGRGVDIFNADALAKLENIGGDKNKMYTVVDVSSYSDYAHFREIRFYLPQNRAPKYYMLDAWTPNGLLIGDQSDPDAINGWIGSPQVGGIIESIMSGVASTFNEVAVLNALRWEIREGSTVLASGTPDAGTISPPSGVMDYAPLIEIGVTGAVSGVVGYINENMIALNTPATIGDPSDPKTLRKVYIDCETLNAYTEISGVIYNLNRYVTIDGVFVCPGDSTTSVYINSLIDYIKIIPRWWKL